ncbi:MAG: response regulator transcription factor [Propionibacterium sp.]|nr:response regulator transcription factor [Propionibacterium sp.]
MAGGWPEHPGGQPAQPHHGGLPGLRTGFGRPGGAGRAAGWQDERGAQGRRFRGGGVVAVVNRRVLVVDDDALVRAGLKLLLSKADSGIEVVGEGTDGSDAVALVAEHTPDVVLMDIRMPQVDGITATRQVLTQPEPPKVVMLTTFDADELVLEALRAGAHGFLLKDTSPEEMIRAIHRAAEGERSLSPSVIGAVIAAATSAGVDDRTQRARTDLEVLSKRELEVAVEVGRGLSNAEIATKLYHSLATVKATLTRVLTKLGCTNRTQVAILVHDARLLDS